MLLNAGGGCTIGGQIFENFRLETWATEPGRHPSLTASEIFVTPVDYVADGKRWLGVRYGTATNRVELGANPLPPLDPTYGWIYGYMNSHDLRFHVDGDAKIFTHAKVGYGGLVANGSSNMNIGYSVFADEDRNRSAMYNIANFRFAGRNDKAPKAETMTLQFSRAIDDFDVRSSWWDRPLTQWTYGISFRNNRYGHLNDNTGVDWVEYSFGTDVASAPIINPEPGTLALLAGGLGLVGVAARRRRRATTA